MQAIKKYLYLKKATLCKFLYDTEDTSGKSARAYATVAKWHAEFKRWKSMCDDLHQCGRPSSSVNEETVEKVNTLVTSD